MLILNYTLNKFLPFLIIAGLLVYSIGYQRWEPYAIFGLILFIERFSFKTGYAVAFCESKGVDLSN